MKIEKAKYKINLTEEDKNAILRVIGMVDTLYDGNICSERECSKCPFEENFCIAKVNNDDRIKVFLDRLEKFINRD